MTEVPFPQQPYSRHDDGVEIAGALVSVRGRSQPHVLQDSDELKNALCEHLRETPMSLSVPPGHPNQGWPKKVGEAMNGDIQVARELLVQLLGTYEILPTPARRDVTEVLLSLSREQGADNRSRDILDAVPANVDVVRVPRRDRTFSEPVILVTALFMLVFHIGAVAALFMFSWRALILTLFLWWLATSLGIGVGYHRLLTHRGSKTPKVVEYILTICGTLALQGGPIPWVATHRIHHQTTDKAGDPHSPRDGGFWAHMGWIITGEARHNKTTKLLAYVSDIRKDRFHIWITKWHWVPSAVLASGLLVFGGWNYVLWGIFLRTVVGIHATCLVNSATHMWGPRRFPTHDTSTNNFWVALLTFGEGWHNNHHAHPRSARHGLAWYEFDLNWYEIRLLGMLHLASDVKLPRAPAEVNRTMNAETG